MSDIGDRKEMTKGNDQGRAGAPTICVDANAEGRLREMQPPIGHSGLECSGTRSESFFDGLDASTVREQLNPHTYWWGRGEQRPRFPRQGLLLLPLGMGLDDLFGSTTEEHARAHARHGCRLRGLLTILHRAHLHAACGMITCET